MNLEQFVSKCGTQAKAAKKLGITQGMISMRINKKYKMTPNVAIDLEERSDGEMTRADLLPETFGITKAA